MSRNAYIKEIIKLFREDQPLTLLLPVVHFTVAHKGIQGLSSPCRIDPLVACHPFGPRRRRRDSNSKTDPKSQLHQSWIISHGRFTKISTHPIPDIAVSIEIASVGKVEYIDK
jgi:hypothetical protein